MRPILSPAILTTKNRTRHPLAHQSTNIINNFKSLNYEKEKSYHFR
nr:MAG TPA: hypothetical protein [Caudoviricetes sp.]